jgi:putative nucleotidyltransferase with HDIG domain
MSLTNDILINKDLLNQLVSNKLYKEIIDSKTFKRLENISFLGAIDYTNPTKKKFYRYEHSISVATLALYYAQLKKLNKRDRDYLVVAALLHDIGHAPLSHSIENNFQNQYNINHHKNGNNIIKGNSKFKNEIKDILNSYDIDERYIVDILDGNIDNKATFALTNPINIDTIDGINRCYLSMNYSNKYNKIGLVYSPIDIVKAIVEKNEIVLDSFWELKHRMYKDFIHKPINLYADFFASEFTKSKLLEKDDFNIDDKKLKVKSYELFKSLSSVKTTTIHQELKYKRREYKTQHYSLKYSSDINKRYVSFKNDCRLILSQECKTRREQSLWK